MRKRGGGRGGERGSHLRVMGYSPQPGSQCNLGGHSPTSWHCRGGVGGGAVQLGGQCQRGTPPLALKRGSQPIGGDRDSRQRRRKLFLPPEAEPYPQVLFLPPALELSQGRP